MHMPNFKALMLNVSRSSYEKVQKALEEQPESQPEEEKGILRLYGKHGGRRCNGGMCRGIVRQRTPRRQRPSYQSHRKGQALDGALA